jgi:hypothetical protein
MTSLFPGYQGVMLVFTSGLLEVNTIRLQTQYMVLKHKPGINEETSDSLGGAVKRSKNININITYLQALSKFAVPSARRKQTFTLEY